MRFPAALTRFLFLSAAATMVANGHDTEAQLPFERPHAHDEAEWHSHIGWESRYFSEGRDALDGDSLLFGSFEFGWKHLAGGIWYGNSPERDYDELQLTLAITQSIQEIDFYAGYTHLRFPFANVHDNELGLGFAWLGLPLDLELSSDIYYSFEADGYFAELTLGREFRLSDRLSLNLSSPFGVNQGYVADGHDGANHVALRLALEFAITSQVSLIAHATQSWGLDPNDAFPGDEGLPDFFHGGVGLQLSF